MTRLIVAEDIAKDIEENSIEMCGVQVIEVYCAKALISIAPALVQKTGKWENDENGLPFCSECGYYTPFDHAIDDYEYGNYCPKCGAKMGAANES